MAFQTWPFRNRVGRLRAKFTLSSLTAPWLGLLCTVASSPGLLPHGAGPVPNIVNMLRNPDSQGEQRDWLSVGECFVRDPVSCVWGP